MDLSLILEAAFNEKEIVLAWILQKKKPQIRLNLRLLAEMVGFEPTFQNAEKSAFWRERAREIPGAKIHPHNMLLLTLTKSKQQRMDEHENSVMMAERKAEYERTRAAKRKAEHDALVERAKTDPEAARQLAEQRKYQSEAAVKSYQKMKAAAEAGDQEAIKRYEAHLDKRREDYHKKKEKQEAISA